MRLHTNTLTWHDLHAALKAEKDAGRIAWHVGFKTLTSHGSRSHDRAFEVQLDASERDRGRRAGNTGSYGSDQSGFYSATYDEWGWLIAALYLLDPDAVWGTVKFPQYASASDFHTKTGATYAGEQLLIHLEADDDPYPWLVGKNQKGRRGANRISDAAQDARPNYWPAKHAPRTADWYKAFMTGAEL